MKKNEIISLAKLAMRISLYQFLILAIFSFAASAYNVKAQGALDKEITLSAKNQNIKSIIDKIEVLTSVKFVYSPKSIDALRKISVNANKQKLGDLLNDYLEPHDVGYKVVDDRILLYSISAAKENGLILPRPEMRRDGVITGTVTDGKGGAIVGASIQIKGTTTGATTDANGKFTIKKLEAGSYTIVVTYVGFISKEVAVDIRDENKSIDIALSEDNLQLEGVVVTGGGGNPKTKLESSVALTSVSRKDIVNRAPLNSTDLLKAIPGLTVESTGGDGPGNVYDEHASGTSQEHSSSLESW